MLTDVQRDIEEKIVGFRQDLERGEGVLSRELAELLRQMQAAVQEAQARVRSDGERLKADSEEHRAAIARLRGEVSGGE